MFNVVFDDLVVEQQQAGVTTFSSATLSKLWPYGFSTVGELNYDTAVYTAGYILKKITGSQANEAYLRNDEYGVAFWVKPPYTTMSLKPGIGAEFYEKYKEDFFPCDESPVPGKGIIKKVPRYYETILKQSDSDTHGLVKRLRAEWIANHKHEFTPERLKAKYECARAQQTRKQRTL